MKQIAVPILLSCFAICLSKAQVNIATWDFDGPTPGTAGTILDTTGTVIAIANATGVSASIGRITATITNLPPGGNFGTGLDYVAPYATGTASSGLLNANGFGTSPSTSSYISFRVTIGPTIDPTVGLLEGISFDLANVGTSGPRGVEVTYRIGNSGPFISLGTTRTPTNVANQFGRFTFNLPSATALIANEDVEFRLLGYSNAAANSIRLDNVTITATAIPEPSYFALAVLLLLGTVTLRNFFRNKTELSPRPAACS